jgi:hypothetical protein
MIVFAAPPLPPTATHLPRDGANAIDRTEPIGVVLILTVVQVAPPFSERYIVFPDKVPAKITEKLALAAKHDIIVLVYVAGDAASHAAIASESPEYMMRPLLLFDASLPPINQRLYPPPTHNEAYAHAICVEFGLLIPFLQLKPSFEK